MVRERHRPQQHVHDAKTLTRTELRLKYRRTYDSWKNMKDRSRREDAVIEPEFEDFVTFLLHMGPRPEGCTIDRIDPLNRHYGPGLCRWAARCLQQNNRSNTIMLTCDGETLPLAEWARKTGQKQGTLRARFYKDWSDCEVIKGKAKEPALTPRGFGNPFRWRPWQFLWPGEIHKQEHWEREFRKQQHRAGGERYRLPFIIRALADVRRRITERWDEDEPLPPAARADYDRARALRERARSIFPDWEREATLWYREHGYTEFPERERDPDDEDWSEPEQW